MAAKPAGFAAGEAAVLKFGNGSNVDLPFAMFSHQYESKAIKLYYSMSTISYTPRFSYQINMTLIEGSRILKDRPFAWRSDSGATAMTARSSFNFQLFRPTVRSVFTSILIQSDKVILFHVHDILYSLVFISD